MKMNFFYSYLSLLPLALVLLFAPASATERAPEKSLPVKEALEKPALTKPEAEPVAAEAPLAPAKDGTSKSYMAKFCAGETGSCQTTQKLQVCERFRVAAVNVQQLLDRAVNCETNAADTAADCDGLDAGRIDLLKQYWQDEDMAYTILFLPDMVQNAAASCQAKHGGAK